MFDLPGNSSNPTPPPSAPPVCTADCGQGTCVPTGTGAADYVCACIPSVSVNSVPSDPKSKCATPATNPCASVDCGVAGQCVRSASMTDYTCQCMGNAVQVRGRNYCTSCCFSTSLGSYEAFDRPERKIGLDLKGARSGGLVKERRCETSDHEGRRSRATRMIHSMVSMLERVIPRPRLHFSGNKRQRRSDTKGFAFGAFQTHPEQRTFPDPELSLEHLRMTCPENDLFHFADKSR